MAASQRILLGHIKGEKGDQGDAATIRVGGTTTTAPGGQASVIEGGTPQDRVLTFNIPRGELGPGGGGGLTLRSVATPLVHRIPLDWPFAPNLVLGAMDTLGWGIGAWDYRIGRVWYFTNHATQRIVDGWQRTRRSPRMTQTFELGYGQGTVPMWKTRACPINFATAGYRGNWCRSQGWAVISESLAVIWYLASDYDGLVFTNTNRALWVYGRGNLTGGPANIARWLFAEEITLPGLANAAITGMWAGIEIAPPEGTSRLWVIQNNRLYLCAVRHNTQEVRSGGSTTITPGVQRRLTGAADFTFTEVTDPALPITIQRVYAEGRYAAVWGWTNTQTNRLAFFDGTQWYALTIPFGWGTGSYISNAVVIFANGRIGAYNLYTGDYYTCDNPSAGAAATWELRFRTQSYRMLTNGFNRGVPQFVARGGTQSTGAIWCAFDGSSDDGGKCYVNPNGPTNVAMSWPSELYCSTSRPDIIPSTNATHGYAYSWGTQVTHAHISDRNTLMLATSYATPVWNPPLPMPDSLEAAIPNHYTDGPQHRFGPFKTRQQQSPSSALLMDTFVGIAPAVGT